jgi:lysophospholipase L1-like esterase
MFNFRRRRKFNYSNPYSRKSKRYPKFSLLWLIVAVPIFLILLELLAWGLLSITGKGGNLAEQSSNLNAYRLKFLTESQKPIEGLGGNGKLLVQRSPSLGYQLVAQQKSQFFQINDQGFRDKNSLPLAKPKNEIRIFILGGSTAFGQGIGKNEGTISYQIQTRLQQQVQDQKRNPAKYRPDVFPFFKPERQKLFALRPKILDKKYRVINAAVPGYTSGNELAQLALQILPYQPDFIVVLDGYGDLMLSSRESMADIPKIDQFLQNASGHFQSYFNQAFSQWLGNTSLVTAFKTFILKPQPSLMESVVTASLPKDEAELKLRVSRYRKNQQKLIQFSSALGIPVVLAIQPEITGISRDKLSKSDRAIREKLSKDYQEKMPQAYQQLIQASQQLEKSFPNKVKVLNLYNLPVKLANPNFSDPIHLTEKANTAIAEQLYQAIINWRKIQIIPQNFDLKD